MLHCFHKLDESACGVSRKWYVFFFSHDKIGLRESRFNILLHDVMELRDG